MLDKADYGGLYCYRETAVRAAKVVVYFENHGYLPPTSFTGSLSPFDRRPPSSNVLQCEAHMARSHVFLRSVANMQHHHGALLTVTRLQQSRGSIVQLQQVRYKSRLIC